MISWATSIAMVSPVHGRCPHWAAALHRAHTWHITGSLLGLDVTLAELSLLRLSSRPPARRPTLSDEDRRVMTESVALTQPAALTDQGLGMVLDTLRKGRARLAAIRTDADARALAVGNRARARAQHAAALARRA